MNAELLIKFKINYLFCVTVICLNWKFVWFFINYII